MDASCAYWEASGPLGCLIKRSGGGCNASRDLSLPQGDKQQTTLDDPESAPNNVFYTVHYPVQGAVWMVFWDHRRSSSRVVCSLSPWDSERSREVLQLPPERLIRHPKGTEASQYAQDASTVYQGPPLRPVTAVTRLNFKTDGL